MSAPSPLNASSSVNHTIIVLSGKGGVGKSTVACQLALSLAHISRKRVGILDVDICGPSVPKICGVEDKSITMCEKTGLWLPVEVTIPKPAADSTSTRRGDDRACLKVMSIAYLLPNATDAVVWRGPRKDAMIKQFLSDVKWGDLDYLIVDTPPGTSDEHMTLCEAFCKVASGIASEGGGDVSAISHAGPTGAVVVTTPQDVSTDDVRKELNFCAKLHLRVLGIVENMSGFVCPNCSETTDIFSKGGGKRLSDMYQCPFLGTIPIDPRISVAQDNGESVAVMNLLEEQKAWKDAAEADKGDGEHRDGEDSEAMLKDGSVSNGILDVVQNIRALAFKVERLRKEGKAL